MLVHRKKTHLLWRGKTPILYSVQFYLPDIIVHSVSRRVNWQVLGMRAGSRVSLALCTSEMVLPGIQGSDSGASFGPALAGKLVLLSFPQSALPLVSCLRMCCCSHSLRYFKACFCFAGGQEALAKGMNRLCLIHAPSSSGSAWGGARGAAWGADNRYVGTYLCHALFTWL